MHPNKSSYLVARYGLPALIVVLVLVSFLPVLSNDFVNWDDTISFTENPSYRGLSLHHLKWMFTTTLMGHYQPLSWLTHGVVYSVWGMDPRGYHLVNLVLHAANTLAFYLLTLALLRRVWPQRGQRTDLGIYVGAAVGALVFALHPLRVEAVAWVTERREVLYSFFLLATLLAYLRMHDDLATHRRTRLAWYFVSLGCFLLSLLSKASGMTFPVVLLVLDTYPLGRFSGKDGRWQSWGWVLAEKVPYIVLAAAAAAEALITVHRTALLSLAEHGWIARTMQAAYGLYFYLWKTLVPVRLSPLYLLRQPLDPAQPIYIFSALVVTGITIGLIRLRRRYPWALAAWTCYVVIVSPVLGFAQSGPQLAADRYTYVACLPWAVLAAAGVYQLWLAAEARRLSPAALYSAAATIVVVLALLGLQAHAQTGVWKDSLALWNHVLEIEPDSHIAFNNRGNAREANGDIEGALADYNESIRLNPRFGNTYNNRGNTRQAKGDLAGAIADFNEAIRLSPSDANAFANRGNARQAQRDFEGAIADYTQALRLDPRDTKAHYNRGNTYQAKGNLNAAIADYDAAIGLNPGYTDAYTNRGTARQARGDAAVALADFTQALHLNPADGNAAYNRGNTRKTQGDLDGALADYTYAIQQNPRHAGAYNSRGRIRQQKGDLDGALADYDQAIRLNPEQANAYNNRGTARQAKGDLAGAIADYLEALRLTPTGGPHHDAFERNLAAARQQLAARPAAP